MALRPSHVTEAIPERYLATLVRCLATVNPRTTTVGDFAQQLTKALQGLNNEQRTIPAPMFITDDEAQLLLSTPEMTQVVQAINQEEQRPLREIVDFLETVIAKRAARDDLWPEGRLQLGIAYATLQEYANARRVLQEVIQICESGGRYMERAEMAA
jgi:hypothetical protein